MVDDLIKYAQELQEREKVEKNDIEKKDLLFALKDVLFNAAAMVAMCESPEVIKIGGIKWNDAGGDSNTININFEALDRSVRRQLLLDFWSQIEQYITKKVSNPSARTSQLVTDFFGGDPANVPAEVTFFRELRNTTHGDGVHKATKQEIECTLNGDVYKLVPGKGVDFMNYEFILKSTRISLNSLLA